MDDQIFRIKDISVPVKRRRTLDPTTVNKIAESMLAGCQSLGEQTIVGVIVQARRK